MRKKIISDITANTLQVIINQTCGLVIFYILSRSLSKAVFGEFNWALAVLLTLFNILSLGVDQLIVKKIAAGLPTAPLMALYHGHTLLTGLGTAALTFLATLLFPGFFDQHQLILLLGLGKLLIFFSMPYKQAATGLEQFKTLLRMSVVSNSIRCTGLLVLLAMDAVDSHTIILLFVAGDLLEWCCSYRLTTPALRLRVHAGFGWRAYRQLLREASPQLGVILFTSALARFDWIFLGIFCSTTILAEYSFAYKVYEVATMPLLIIAPMLLPRFVKMLTPANDNRLQNAQQFSAILTAQLTIATGAALLLNFLWMPVIGPLTHDVYSTVNRVTVLLLSIGIPFLFLNNFLWTVLFCTHRLRTILGIFATSFTVNIIGNLVLIPLYQAEGAAAAFTLAAIVQSICCIVQTKSFITRLAWRKALLVTGAGAIAVLVDVYTQHWWWGTVAAFASWLVMLMVINPLHGLRHIFDDKAE